MLQLLYNSLMTKLSIPSFLKIFIKHLKNHYFTYLFTVMSSSAWTNHVFTKLRNCWQLARPSTECNW